MKTYIYKLTLIDRLVLPGNWNTNDEMIVGEHFAHLQSLLEKDVLLLAGKTEGQDETTYGLVIFKAKTMEDALKVMKSDPAIVKGIMTGYLHEYNLALFNNKYTT